MKVDFLTRFDRSFEKLELSTQIKVRKDIESFLANIQKGIRPQGMGLRRLRGSFWEIRCGLKYRVLFELKKDWITFILVGNHNEVKRFIKSPK